MKIFKKLLLFAPIALLVIYVNVFGDVNMQFYKYTKIREICEAFSNGYNIQSELVDSINKRQLAKVNTEYRIPKTIVLGSSRTMQLTGNLLEEEDFYNDSVGYAVLEDYVGIMEMYAEHDFPDKVIIGVDPWVFNENNIDIGVDQAKFWDHEIDSWKKRLGFDANPAVMNKYKNYSDIFSLVYFQDSVVQLFIDSSVHITRDDSVEVEPVYTFEGVKLSKEDNLAPATKDSVTMSAKEMLHGKFNDFTELGSEKRELFEKSIEYLQKSNVEVVILLIPFHPYMVEYFKDQLPVYFEVEDYLVDFADEHGIICYGSYEPDVCSVSGECFYPDGVHIRDMSAFQKLMAYKR